MSDAAPARVTLLQRPKTHVLDSRSLPGQQHTGQNQVAQYAHWVLVAAVAARLAWFLGEQLTSKRRKPKGSQTPQTAPC
ncbi:TPA: hypothetical protein ACH3X2_011202 [Trebouxia sp. C0005]